MENPSTQIIHGDCLDALRSMPGNSVDSVVTDPPYGLSFMGKKWDYDVPSEDIWRECLRVLKPGGHLLAFAGTRTQHRMAVRIEDAGFEIRDMIAWVYGSGFPKSLDVSKAIDKAAGAEVSSDGYIPNGKNNTHGKGWSGGQKRSASEPSTPAAIQWNGWGTALKPALEPITMARKPFKATVAANVLEHGTGAINVDGCRVGTESTIRNSNAGTNGEGWGMGRTANVNGSEHGRFPANLIHDGSEEVVRLFPQSKTGAIKPYTSKGVRYEGGWGARRDVNHAASEGSASRFFYCAKTSKRDRDEGCDGLEEKTVSRYGEQGQGPTPQQTPRVSKPQKNAHPTVKPTDLMRYLCRLVTPPGGVVLDPFMGSGSTGKAALLEGFKFIGIEREAEYVEIARARIGAAVPGGGENGNS